MAARKREQVRGPERYWPVPAIPRHLPKHGEPGSFWEDRGDRRHCGVDLHAPPGSVVVAMEGGTVVKIGIATSPDTVPYWNLTRSVAIESGDGRTWRYGELAAALVSEGDRVAGGQVIGTVGQVLDCGKVDAGSPPYIRDLCARGAASMLHLELADRLPVDGGKYLGGNWFGKRDRTFPFRDPAPSLQDAR
ncbi:MAG: M23 family metallopeptidase [Methanomicrobiales archaeon]|nr:M23 family metallopeptidase [Methanomicrobiales archaeon]